MSAPHFWSTPLRYLRWASYEKPAIFYSIIVGSMGPVALVTLPPIRRFFGDVDPEPIPLTYPIRQANVRLPPTPVPKGPRVIPQGFDDE
ncbi:putative NADH-ubiquinone oxidoreductase 9.5 kDa subunit [Paecilomyces variotii]|uniref:Putative NADH-ubiquinone oxidoreductase 9.5 kDa subunit n=1 Tax=Byssochlamys spectabilis TaxID=264951 RepID=A0A443HQA9_BYSSP|nr:putative NADH-ubiquinone oxidoreductase 9.5 kDa subunit [Paecilomyces variotii]RWQ93987.1 putative NADH-ubiquinone oxidoreductase 9.5 kDa subunit [Paecilomyces variotii]